MTSRYWMVINAPGDIKQSHTMGFLKGETAAHEMAGRAFFRVGG